MHHKSKPVFPRCTCNIVCG